MQKLLQRVYDGLDEVWDGNNYRGVLNDDAQDAEGDIRNILEEVEQAVVWEDLDQDLGELPDDQLWPEGKFLSDAANAFDKAAQDSGEYIPEDVGEWIIKHFVWKWENGKKIPSWVEGELLASGDISTRDSD